MSSLRFVANGAEPVSIHTLGRFIERFGGYGFRPGAMAPVYGLAECAVALALPPPGRGPLIDRVKREALSRRDTAEPAAPDDPNAIEIVACGRPVPGHEIRIVDDAGRELAERREGRLEFRGPSATSGYFRNEAKTRELFRDGWLDSGDRAYMANGDVFITGRIKDIIIRAGQHIYPHELEEAVGDIAGLVKGGVAVFGVADPASGTERIVILAETTQVDAAERDALKARARTVVTDIVGSPPDDIVLVQPGTVPKTSSGKIRRAAAKERYLAQQFDLPRRALRWQIARLWLAGIGGRLTRLRRTAGEYLYAGWWWTILAICVAIGAVSGLCAAAPHVALGGRADAGARAPSSPWAFRSPSRASSGYPNGAGSWCSITPAMPTRSWLRRCCQASRPIWSRGSSPASSSPARCCAGWGRCSSTATTWPAGLPIRRLRPTLAREGRVLVVFPEGTFTRQAGLLEFFTGAFKIASEADLPVYPGVLRGTRSMLRSDQWFPRRGRIEVEIR